MIFLPENFASNVPLDAPEREQLRAGRRSLYSKFFNRPPDAETRIGARRLAGGPSLPPGVPGLTAWQYTGATMRRPLKTIEGARNATDHERINARPCSDCARSSRPVRELWPRGVRCD